MRQLRILTTSLLAAGLGACGTDLSPHLALGGNATGGNGGAASALCGDGVVDPGEACDDGAANGSGVCSASCTLTVGACPTAWLTCGGACVDPASDAAHCGSCEVACALGEACADGACVAASCGALAVVSPAFRDATVPTACAGWAVEAEPIRFAMEVVVGVDSAMNRPAPGTTATRWEVIRAALVSYLEAGNHSGEVGAVFHPNLGPTGAVASTSPGPVSNCIDTGAMLPLGFVGGGDLSHVEAFADLAASVEPGPGRPLEDALALALELAASAADAVHHVVLLIDGAPTLAAGCSNPAGNLFPVDPQPLLDAVEAARAQSNVHVHVVGLPGSETERDWLSAAAVLGGTAPEGCDPTGSTPCHHDLSESADLGGDLVTTLVAIQRSHFALDGTFPCQVSLPTPPEGYDLDEFAVNVWLRLEQTYAIPRDPTGECAVGWTVSEDDELVLSEELCGALARYGANASAEITFGCTETTCEGIVCPAGTTCVDGACLSVPASQCGDGVVTGLESCDDGNLVGADGCSAQCLSEATLCPSVWQAECGAGCVDLEANAAHCGGCGVACVAGTSCVAGLCVSLDPACTFVTCPAGTSCIDGVCAASARP